MKFFKMLFAFKAFIFYMWHSHSLSYFYSCLFALQSLYAIMNQELEEILLLSKIVYLKFLLL